MEFVEELRDSLIYDRKSICPLCGEEQYNKFVKIRRSRIVGSDTDLRPNYDKIDLLKYNVLVCNHCGFAATVKMQKDFSKKQLEKIKNKISGEFASRNYGDFYDYSDAIERHKLALYNCIVAEKDDVIKGYMCLKIAWLYRGMKEEAENAGEGTVFVAASNSEVAFLKMAFDGLNKGLINDSYPVLEIDKDMGAYICADIARKSGDYKVAIELIMKVIHSKSVGHKLKERAIDLKEMIQKQINAEKKRLQTVIGNN